MRDEIRAQIEAAVQQNEILLFMKGTPVAPNCGFSAATIEILDSLLGKSYASVDVLAHPEIRDGIKEFSSWPTIPQLYVKGEFLGGADIIAQLFESGELHSLLGVAATDAAAPEIDLSEEAHKALRGYLEGSNEVILLGIDRGFEASLSLGPKPDKGVLVEKDGVTIAMDRLTAARASGLKIDFIETEQGPAFKIDNPNQPKAVTELSVHELKNFFDEAKAFRLIDVRTQGEWETAKIQGAELLDEELKSELMQLPKETVLVMQCHHGHRSLRAGEQFVQQGFSQVYNLTGGIDSWSDHIDPSVPKY